MTGRWLRLAVAATNRKLLAEVELLLYENWLDNDGAKQEHDGKATRVVFTGAANVAKQAP
jgi:hypothetical protein